VCVGVGVRACLSYTRIYAYMPLIYAYIRIYTRIYVLASHIRVYTHIYKYSNTGTGGEWGPIHYIYMYMPHSPIVCVCIYVCPIRPLCVCVCICMPHSPIVCVCIYAPFAHYIYIARIYAPLIYAYIRIYTRLSYTRIHAYVLAIYSAGVLASSTL